MYTIHKHRFQKLVEGAIVHIRVQRVYRSVRPGMWSNPWAVGAALPEDLCSLLLPQVDAITIQRSSTRKLCADCSRKLNKLNIAGVEIAYDV